MVHDAQRELDGRLVHIYIHKLSKLNLRLANEVRSPVLAQVAHDYLPVQEPLYPWKGHSQALDWMMINSKW